MLYPQANGATVAYAQAPYGAYTAQPSGQQPAAYGTPTAYPYRATQTWSSNQSGPSQSTGYTQSVSAQTGANVQRLSDGRVWLKGSDGDREPLDARKIDTVNFL
jgi:hypothetical protein